MDRNQRQSRAEEKMLERSAARPGGNVQPREGFGGGSYGGRGGQITWWTGVSLTGGNREGGNISRGGNQTGLTQMQWMSIEEEEEIGHVITVGILAIWPKTVRKRIKQG